MDACVGLFLLAMGVFLVAVVGHGLWVLVSIIFKGLPPPASAAVSHRRRCVACGTGFSNSLEACPACGLDPHGETSVELHELEATVRQVQALVERGDLEAGAAEQIYQKLEARQANLLGGLQVSLPFPDDKTEWAPTWQRLNRLLFDWRDVKRMSLLERRQALTWYKRLTSDELARLYPESLLTLARLLRVAGFTTRALQIYETIVEHYAHMDRTSEAALEAGRFALAEHRLDLARRFLRAAHKGALDDRDRELTSKLLSSLPVEAEPASQASPLVARPPEQLLTPILVPEPAPTAPTLAEPRRSWGEMLAGFMEERNILWGELVGGLLIVGCSIALVISLWRTLEQIPYFPFLILAALTAALFGAGLYTLSHWKLESTSRGLLVIALLLTPLDFLVLAGLARGRESEALDWVVEILALVGFTGLVLRAARILVEPSPANMTGAARHGWWRVDWLLTGAVMMACASQILTPHWLDGAAPAPWLFVLLSLTPVIAHGAACGLALAGPRTDERVVVDRANAILLFLGIGTFAVGVALGFIVYWSDDALWAIRHLAIPFTLAAVPLLVCGLFVSQGLRDVSTETDPAARGLSPTVARLVGTMIAWTGAALMLAALGLGWPRPAALIIVGAFNTAVLGGVAFGLRLPSVHVASLPCFTIAFLTAIFEFRGELTGNPETLGPQLLTLAISPVAGVCLTILALFLALSSETFARLHRRVDALYHVAGGGLAATLALLLVARVGNAEPERACIVFGVVGLACLGVNLRWRRAWLTVTASFVLAAFSAYGFYWWNPALILSRLWTLSLLSHATSSLLAAVLLTGWLRNRQQLRGELTGVFVIPLRSVGLASTFGALAPLVLALEWNWLPECAACWLWLATIWLFVAWLAGWPGLFALGQAALTMALLIGVSAWLHDRQWLGDHARELLQDSNAQVYAAALAGLGLFWALARLAVGKNAHAMALLEPGWGGVDWAATAGLVVAFLAWTASALLPEILRETMPERFHRDIPRIFAGFPEIDLPWAWATLALLGAALVASLWGKRPRDAVIGGVLWTLTAAGIVAYGLRGEWATGSMLRWELALAFLGGSALSWARRDLRRYGEKLGIEWAGAWNVTRWGRGLLLGGAMLPVLVLTTIVAIVGFEGQRPAGPRAEALFAAMGWTANVVTPLLMLAIGLTANGARENAPGYISSAGLVLLATVTGGYALGVTASGRALDVTEAIYMVQLGILAASLWAIAWLASGRWQHRFLLTLQIGLSLGMIGTLLVPAIVEVLRHASGPWPAYVIQTGAWVGWAGLLTSVAAALWVFRLWARAAALHLLACAGLALGILAACAVAPFDFSSWLSYHVLTLAWTTLAISILVASWVADSFEGLGPFYWPADRRLRIAGTLAEVFPVSPARRWVEIMSALVVLLALGGAWGDPSRPYWSCAATLAVCVLIGAMAVWARRPWYVYASGLLLNVTAYLVWQAWLVDRWDVFAWFPVGPDLFDRFLLLQIMALSVASLIWSLIENHLRRREPPVDLRNNALPFAHVAVLLAVQLLAVLGLGALGADLFALGVHVLGMLPWLVVSATAIALLASLWDPEARLLGLPLAPLYVLGLCAGALALHQQTLAPRQLGWHGSLLLGGYVLVTAVLAWSSPRWSALARRLILGPRFQGWLVGWFVPAQRSIAVLALGLSFWICLDFNSVSERLAGPSILALLACAAGLMIARWSELASAGDSSTLKNTQPPVAIVLGLWALAIVQLCWSFLDLALPALWLHRNVLLLAVLVVVGSLYRVGVPRWLPAESAWNRAARSHGQGMLALAGAVLALVLVQEFVLYDRDLLTTPLARSGVAFVAGLLVAMMAAGLWLAVAQRNPLELSDTGRVWCVWAAELLIVLLFVHIRLNFPQLLLPFLGQNWHFVLMTLGFLGVGLAELFRRRGLPMLAKPLHQTGLFLPLLPLLAYMARPLADFDALVVAIPGLGSIQRYLEFLPGGYGVHALLWFLLGLLYALIAVMRRASTFALIAALVANFGLWVIYAHNEQLTFLLHPQIWLLPIGLIVLAAEHLHRERLTSSQAEGLRYSGLLIVYLSSTADMFITGLGNSLVLPVVLSTLSVAGVLAGIMLRVRAFLFTGVAFLFLVVFAQIWHAAVDRAQTWVWWASGIVLGIAILTLFALFEKRRNDVLAMLEDLKRWR
ncbi:MAG: hypothetical protein HY040_26625 [Planctomycetes bacterium]|nr:hypothetical protein [Planctomycetota bacterium]